MTEVRNEPGKVGGCQTDIGERTSFGDTPIAGHVSVRRRP